MKKTLIASAVAAATLSSGAFAESAPVTSVYGEVLVHYTHTEDGNDVTTNGFDDNGSIIGFSHEHQISEGVTGFAAVEFAFDFDDGDVDQGGDDDTALDGLTAIDAAYVGVRGDFGEAIYGVDDTVSDWIDYLDTGESLSLGGGIANTKDHEFLQYVSPEVTEGLTLGVTLPVESDATYAGSLAAKYAAPMVEGLEVALAYTMGRDEGDPSVGGDAGQNTIGLGASYTMDDITVLAQFESEDETASGAQDNSTYFGLQGMYAMGQNQFALGYGRTNFGGDNGIQAGWYLQALHNVSDHMYVYFEYLAETAIDGTDGNDLDSLALGAAYTF